jgi:hypothetical protein
MIESPLLRASVFLGIAMIAACGSPPAAETPEQPEARAETGGTAEVLFDEAVALADAGKLEEACKKFEASERLEHAPGTLLNLADCYEKTQRVASAFEAWNKVAVEARDTGKAARAQEARSRADALKPRISKLVINLGPEVTAIPGLVVKRNGALVERALWGQSVPVDAGEQTVVVSAPGKAPRRETIVVGEAESKAVSVDVLADPKMPGQKIGAIAAGGVGVAAIVFGSVVGAMAMSRWGEAVEACNGPATSPTSCSTPKGVADASALGSEANALATISTVGFVVGGVGLAAAGILWFTTPRDAAAPASASFRVVPVVGPQGLGGVVQRSF